MLKQLERMFGKESGAPRSFSSHRWGEQPLTSANGGGAGGGHDAMGNSKLRKPFVSCFIVITLDVILRPAKRATVVAEQVP